MPSVCVLIPLLHGVVAPAPDPGPVAPASQILVLRHVHCARLLALNSDGAPVGRSAGSAPREAADTNPRGFEEDDKVPARTVVTRASGAAPCPRALLAMDAAARSHLRLGARVSRVSILRC